MLLRPAELHRQADDLEGLYSFFGEVVYIETRGSQAWLDETV